VLPKSRSCAHHSRGAELAAWTQRELGPVAGLPPLRFHDLRHTHGSLLVAGGVDLISVKSAMGHSQIATTERYLHARPATELADRSRGRSASRRFRRDDHLARRPTISAAPHPDS